MRSISLTGFKIAFRAPRPCFPLALEGCCRGDEGARKRQHSSHEFPQGALGTAGAHFASCKSGTRGRPGHEETISSILCSI